MTRFIAFTKKIKTNLYDLLHLPESMNEEDIQTLIVQSIKFNLNKNLSTEDISRITKYDCHQTNLIIQKKVLTIMSLEKIYKIQLTDEEYEKITTFAELASVFYSALQRGSYV